MNWLIVAWALTFGFNPQLQEGVSTLNSCYLVDSANSLYTDFSLHGTILGHVDIFGNVKTYENALSLLSYAPFRADYGIGLSVHDNHVKFTVYHECDHGVIHNAPSIPDKFTYFANKTSFSLTISGEGGL